MKKESPPTRSTHSPIAKTRTSAPKRASVLPVPDGKAPLKGARRTAARETPTNGRIESDQRYETPLDPEQILAALNAIKNGDFKVRLPLGWTGIAGKVADTFNEVAVPSARSPSSRNSPSSPLPPKL